MPIDPLTLMDFFIAEVCERKGDMALPPAEGGMSADSYFKEPGPEASTCVSLGELLRLQESSLLALVEVWRRAGVLPFEMLVAIDTFIKQHRDDLCDSEETVRKIQDFVYTVV